ncbi:MAG TPA: heme-binding domain-containing protein [Verrucomicrobiae bacterium]|nr:heme-binding domain-containing protein [Verrucomicrobiae bacterium]
MKKKWKWIFGALVAVFVMMQFFNPSRVNPPAPPGGDIAATNPPPPQIMAMLHAACYDCHSDETVWPWYSHVAPVSWLIASDVNGGRRHVNFSEWPHDHPDWAARRLSDVSDELYYNEMPPVQYKLMHPASRLTGAQRKELENWADSTAKKLQAPAASN